MIIQKPKIILPKMTIDIKSASGVTHEENLFWGVRCYSCEDCSEKDGTPLGPPLLIADFTKELTFQKALELAKFHEEKKPDGKYHQIF